MNNQTNSKIEFIDVVVLVLSVYVLGMLIYDTFFHIPAEIQKIVGYFDNFICAVFLYEFIYKYFKSENKLTCKFK